MPWVRIDENAMDHPKFVALSANAWRLWCEGMTYCQKHLTDGFIPLQGAKGMRYYSPTSVKLLLASLVPGKGPLWHDAEGGYRVHDFHDWNETREKVLADREWGKRRKELYSDPGLLDAVRRRDGQTCRYCGRTVNWKDRRGPEGGTFDHVVARGPNTIENIVVACRGCNSSKGNRDLAACGMSLRSVSELVPEQNGPRPTPLHVTPLRRSKDQERQETYASPSDELSERAGLFVRETYPTLYAKYRKGARYIGKPNLDYLEAIELCRVWDDARLAKVAQAFLTTDHPFAESGSRTIAQFRALASWCDSQLLEAGIV